MLKVDKGILIPEGRSGVTKYPWNEMEIGDSFFLEKGNSNTLRCAASYAGSRNNKKFIVRKVGGGARAWRIE